MKKVNVQAKVDNTWRKFIMEFAWEMAKQSAEKFGGKAVEYISGSMKYMWAKAKERIAEMQKAEEVKENSVKVAAWFVKKNDDLRYNYKEKANKVIKETEKAVLLSLEPEVDNFSAVTTWVPKSCLVN